MAVLMRLMSLALIATALEGAAPIWPATGPNDARCFLAGMEQTDQGMRAHFDQSYPFPFFFITLHHGTSQQEISLKRSDALSITAGDEFSYGAGVNAFCDVHVVGDGNRLHFETTWSRREPVFLPSH